MEILEKVSLKDWAWWKIGGPADFFCLPRTVDEIREAIRTAREKGWLITVLGGGTNVLISDQGVQGLVICMKHFTGIERSDSNGLINLSVLAGTPKSDLTKIFMKAKLAPALFMCGLPGDVGGGVVMNAGVAEQVVPREFVEITDWIEYFDLNDPELDLIRKTKNELKWKYRASAGWQPGIVVRAGLSWPLEEDPEIPNKVREATRNRLQRQPLELPSCGSTFKNPNGHKAGALIDQAGLKGFQIGGAQVSPKHANFIVNVGGATAADVSGVIKHIKTEVKAKFNVELETEVRFLGRW
ncbi:MAG: UDP-N-acetylmuramate dehydrogenase [Pseudobdellovibrionaceae bacterium]